MSEPATLTCSERRLAAQLRESHSVPRPLVFKIILCLLSSLLRLLAPCSPKHVQGALVPGYSMKSSFQRCQMPAFAAPNA